MAAYTQTTNFLTSLNRCVENWNNTTNKEMIKNIFATLNYEFGQMETLGLAGYSVASTSEQAIKMKADNMSNDTMRSAVQDFLKLLWVEVAAVETNGLAYTTTANVVRDMKDAMRKFPNVAHRMAMDKAADIFAVELALLVAAS